MPSIRILGIHPIVPSDELFATTRDMQWGDDLSGNALIAANEAVRQHFDALHLIEIAVSPADAVIDWNGITQPISGQSSDRWQAPYDEQPIGSGRWAFFFHYLDLSKPLQTEVGSVELPPPTPLPQHLAVIKYEAPG